MMGLIDYFRLGHVLRRSYRTDGRMGRLPSIPFQLRTSRVVPISSKAENSVALNLIRKWF